MYCKFALLFLLVIQPAIFCAEKDEATVKFSLPNPSEIGTERFALLLNTFLKKEGYKGWHKDLRPRATGPFFVQPSGLVESFGVHGSAAVQVCYSPQVWEWMQNERKGLIADGGMIVKLLYARNPKEPAKFADEPTSFSIMVKDSKGSWDGWFYSDGGPLQKPSPDHAAAYFDPNAGFALSCINCHASTDNSESTYSSIRNTTTGPPFEHPTSISPEGLKKGLIDTSDVHSAPVVKAPRPRGLQPPSPHWDLSADAASMNEPSPLPFSILDHIPQGPQPDGRRAFITSSNCMACHDAVQLYSARPNMMLNGDPKAGERALVNLSTGSEWRYSMMGLSGRDPVFFAQLESERALHPELAEQIDDKCLSCHAVMGQRQWKQEHGADSLFSHTSAQAEAGSRDATYGALARDGISCVVCHQMLPDGLGEPRTYTGKFKLQDKPKEIFGPYEKVATLPMEQAIGLTAKYSADISHSKLCASCHVVVLPVLEIGRKHSPEELERLSGAQEGPQVFHEQATYFEWKNSSFSTEAPTPERGQAGPGPQRQNCQGCHMPRTYNGAPLRFRIANIEDDTFPPVDHRAPNEQLHMEVRDPYSRHSLNGINLFMLEMFKQNPWLLGMPCKDNLCPDPDVKSGFDAAIESAIQMAQEQTAEVKILSVKRSGNRLSAQVQVSNLAGHKFPTGINFRRAFIEFKVQAGEKTIWISGATDAWGVIGTLPKGAFAPLKSELFTDKKFQPHYEKIDREDQVQIYEELVAGSDGVLTTSVLSFKTVIKDNRLLPHGWNPAGPYADLIHPVGTAEDKDYQNGEGKDVISYEVPIDGTENETLSVSTALYYQALPPYYLKQRFGSIDKPDSQRLYYLVNQLDLKNTAVKDWKLKISSDLKQVE